MINGPRDGLFHLLAPILQSDDDFVDHLGDDMPSIDDTIEFHRENGTPTWWPTDTAIRRSGWLQELGRASWESEGQRRAVLYEHLRRQLPASLVTPRTAAERQRVATALQVVYGGLRDGASGWLL